jgi:hypothetical protein
MAIKNAVGRPPKINFTIVDKIADSISNNYSISDSCKFAHISKSTYYYYLNNEPLFAEKMSQAHKNRNKVNFNFRTIL